MVPAFFARRFDGPATVTDPAHAEADKLNLHDVGYRVTATAVAAAM